MPPSDFDERPDSCAFRTGTATVSSAVVGGVLGALTATWSVRRTVWPLSGRALSSTAGHAQGVEKQGDACSRRHRAGHGPPQPHLRSRGRPVRGRGRALPGENPRPPPLTPTASAWRRARAGRRTSGTACWAVQRRAACWACEVRPAAPYCSSLTPASSPQPARWAWAWARPPPWL